MEAEVVEAEAEEVVKILGKRKHFDERDWKQKQKIPKVRKRKRTTRKHKTLRGAGSRSIKNLTASTSRILIVGAQVPWSYM